jgi:pyruvate,water dikinase
MPAKKVRTGLPINLHVLDLDGGLPADSGRVVARDQILSLPLQAMFRGMYYPGVTWSGPIGLNLKGLMVIMAQSSSRPEEHFWDRTLALISLEYMNYQSRLGYHYASVDANLSDEPFNNHVRFAFKGGAADDLRRARRARFIGAVLERIGFDVKVKEDLVQAGFRRRPRLETEGKLDLLGRLMGCSRQRDMVMNDDAIVGWHIDAFLRGNYSFSPEA